MGWDRTWHQPEASVQSTDKASRVSPPGAERTSPAGMPLLTQSLFSTEMQNMPRPQPILLLAVINSFSH